MPRGDGTGPDGRSGCLNYGLPYGSFRQYGGRGRGMGRGRWTGQFPGNGPFSDLPPYLRPGRAYEQMPKEILVQQKEAIEIQLGLIKKALGDSLDKKLD